MPRYARQRDANEPQLLAIFDGMKVPVKRMDPVVPGWPDLCAVIAGIPHFPEIKTDAGYLTDDQEQLRTWLVSIGVKVDDYFPVLRKPAEVIAWVNARRKVLWKEGH